MSDNDPSPAPPAQTGSRLQAVGSETAPDTSAVDGQHPWPGLDSFSEETRGFFYGRDGEINDLARRVQRKLLTVLFGQSGLGKTSILRAGVVPRLRGEGYCPVYVRISYAPDSPAPAVQIKDAILRATQSLGQWTKPDVAGADETLWEFLHHRDDVLKSADGATLTPLLIFDQFEEIFTLAQTDDVGRARAAAFVTELADLVENRPPRALEARMDAEDDDTDDPIALRYDFERSDYRILISLREDYLAPLEGFKAAMPSITQNRMRLARMTGAEALEAVMRPGGKLVTEEVAGAIVRFIAGGAELQNAEVEPSLLSLICRELNNTRIVQGKQEISPDLLAGSHASILSEFYARALADQPPGVHRFIEDQLLTEGGYRENLAEERVRKAFNDAGAAPGALMQLVDRRLLRIEDRLDLRRVELTHDVLCNVVRAARDLRKETEARAQAERQLHAQREREQTTRTALARSRRITSICLILTILAVAGAAFGYVQMQEAQKTQTLADTTRANAEKLVVYLLDDFYEKLLPIGQVELVGDMASHTLDYYRALPQAARTDESDLNMAQALLSLSKVRLRQGKEPEAKSLVDEAFALLEPKFKRPVVPDELKWRMASILTWQSAILSRSLQMKASIPLLARALSLTASVTTMQDPPRSAISAYAGARVRSAWISMQHTDFESAKKELVLALAILKGRTGLSEQSQYLEASGWLHQALVWSGEHEKAEAVRLAALSAAELILQKIPEHRTVIDQLRNISWNKTISDVAQHQPLRALERNDSTINQLQLRMARDPGETGLIDSLVITNMSRLQILYKLGMPGQSLQALEKILRAYGTAAPSKFQMENIEAALWHAAHIDAELGDTTGLNRTIERMRQIFQAQLTASDGGEQRSALMTLNFSVGVESLRDLAGLPVAGIPTLATQAEQILAAARPGDEHYLSTLNIIHGNLWYIKRLEASAAESRGDFGAAESAIRSALLHGTQITSSGRFEDLLPTQTEHAIALAHLNRMPEASALAQSVLSKQRAFNAAGGGDQILRLEMAKTLYAVALTKPDAGKAELKEAMALLAALPSAMQPYRSVRLWRERINAELTKRSHAS